MFIIILQGNSLNKKRKRKKTSLFKIIFLKLFRLYNFMSILNNIFIKNIIFLSL